MPSLEGGAAAAFVSDAAQIEIFQTVNRLPAGVADRLLDVTQADARPGCAYTSTALYGPQVVQLLQIVPLPSLGDQRIAIDVRGRTVASKRWGYGSEILIRRGPELLMIGSFSARPLPDRFVRGLAVAAAARFSRLP
jgi:hypothetical protein